MRTKVTYHPNWWKKLLSPEEKRTCRQRKYLGQCIDEIYMMNRWKLPEPQHLEFNAKDEILQNFNAFVNFPDVSSQALKIRSVKRQIFREQRTTGRKQIKPQRNFSKNTPTIYYRRTDRKVKQRYVRHNYMHGAKDDILQNHNAFVNFPVVSSQELKIRSVKRQIFREQKTTGRKQIKPQRNCSKNKPTIYYRSTDCKVKGRYVRRNYMHGAWQEVMKNIIKKRESKNSTKIPESRALDEYSDISDCAEDDVDIELLEPQNVKMKNYQMVTNNLSNVYHLKWLVRLMQT